MHDLQINHLRLLLIMARIASLIIFPIWALYDLISVLKYIESVSFSDLITVFLNGQVLLICTGLEIVA